MREWGLRGEETSVWGERIWADRGRKRVGGER